MPEHAKLPATLYSLWSNLIYAAQKAWEWEKTLLGYSLLFALTTVASPYIAIFLPRQVINGMAAETRDLPQLLTSLVAIIGALLLSNLGLAMAREQIEMRKTIYRGSFGPLVEAKTMTMDYAKIEAPAGQTARQKARQALAGNANGGEAIIVHSSNFVAHLSGLLAYGALVASLSPWIMIALACCALLNVLATTWAQRYAASRKTEEAEIEKRRSYVQMRGSELTYAKDMRLFHMTDWFGRLHLGLIQDALGIRKQVEQRFALAEMVESGITGLRDLLAYSYLINLVLQGQITPGDFTLLFGAVAGVSQKETRSNSILYGASGRGCIASIWVSSGRSRY